MKKLFKSKKVKIFICAVLCCGLLCAGAVIGINAYVVLSVKDYILTTDDLDGRQFDCAIVLGAGIWGDEPSPMLRERLDWGTTVYNTGCTDRLLMSGDHGKTDYDEVNIMKDCAVADGIPADNVFMDHAGFSTYESMYRARDVFSVEKPIIVTQKYHLYRAVYDARKLGLDAYGIAAEGLNYSIYNDAREALARAKDFLWCIFKPEPTYLGEVIPISGSGARTDDEVRI